MSPLSDMVFKLEVILSMRLGLKPIASSIYSPVGAPFIPWKDLESFVGCLNFMIVIAP